MSTDFESDYARYRAGEMDDDERSGFERRVLSDPSLAEEVYADLELEQRMAAPLRTRGRWAVAWPWAVPVAAALAMFMVARGIDRPTTDHAPVWRSGTARVQPLSPRGVVESTPRRFVWRRFPAAGSYRFELLDVEGRVVDSRVTADTFAVRDADEGAAWRVIALDELGTALARSAPVPFTVRR